ncbi:MAG: hypothetical protein JSU87_04405 [Gemmatimonadota bacterium]|nr:MAG: hypothetical protein JSU87_04405 [Gemmatimonadota bacterium]
MKAAGQEQVKTGSQVKTGRTTARSVKSVPQGVGNTVRVNRAPESNTLNQRVVRGTSSAATVKQSAGSRNAGPGDEFRERPNRGVDRDEYGSSFRTRPERRSYRHLDYRYRHPDSRRYYRPGYWDGYHYGYTHGYIYGYHLGYRRGYYRHSHYYGPHLVFGYHYGGFAFYSGYWHFAIVIGDPYWHHHHNYYNYVWWTGQPTTLVTWDAAVEAYPADYAFAPGVCVELWLRTRDGVDYAIKIDPRYWNAQDPGELYAALWIELEQTGGLEIQDVNGVVHFFEAGQIQQIEARPCR